MRPIFAARLPFCGGGVFIATLVLFGVAETLGGPAATPQAGSAGTVATGRAATVRSVVEAEMEDWGVRFKQAGKPCLSYQRTPRDHEGKYRRSHYFHPLMDLDGKELTEDFPADHLHHRGVFWAWHQVDVGGQRAGDPWVARKFDWDVRSVDTRTLDDGKCVMRCLVHWKSPDVRQPDGVASAFVEEVVYVAVAPVVPHLAPVETAGQARASTPSNTSSPDAKLTLEAALEHRILDFEIRLRALRQNVRIGGSEDDKGYGGFSVRMQLSPETRFLSQTGEVQPQRTAVSAGPWVDVREARRGITLLAHPSLPAYPPSWILRQQRSMQNAVFPGREPVDLPQGRPLVLRYRLIVHRGMADRRQLQQWHDAYAKARLTDWERVFASRSESPR